MEPTANQLSLAKLAGALKTQIISQFGGATAAFDEAVAQGAAEELTRLNGTKASAADFVKTGTDIGNGIAVETGNKDAINLVADVSLLVNELVDGEFLKALPEGFKVVA